MASGRKGGSKRGGKSGKKKDLTKLVPVKRQVVDKRSQEIVDRTYYVDPNKDAPADKKSKKEEDPTKKKTKKEDDTGVEKTKKDKAPSKKTKKEAEPGDSKSKKTKEEGESGAKKDKKDKKGDALSPKAKDDDMLSAETFDDFAKHDIDPKAAKTFFCRL